MGRLEHQRLPNLPEGCKLELALINPDFPTGPLPGDVMHAVVANPAYWAFCWGSGQGLARYLLENPTLVRNKRVLDLGSGSGVAGIAAAQAGAAEVIACDIDADAVLATAYNAALNNVSIRLVDDFVSEPKYDAVLMADVLYDASNLPLLASARSAAHEVWVADSRIGELADPDYELRAELKALTIPNLGEFDEFGVTRIWRATTTDPKSDDVHTRR